MFLYFIFKFDRKKISKKWQKFVLDNVTDKIGTFLTSFPFWTSTILFATLLRFHEGQMHV